MTDNKLIRIGDRVSIRRRGKKGLFSAEFHFNGKHCRKKLETANEKIAKQRARKLDVELVSGDYAPPTPRLKFTDAKTFFIDTLKEAGRKPKTIVKYEREITNLVEFAHSRGVYHVNDFTPQLFHEYRKQR